MTEETSTHPITLLLIRIRARPELLDAEKQSHAIANFIHTHLLEHILVELKKVLAINVILQKERLIVAALDAFQILAHPLLVPVADRVGTIVINGLREV